ncbi:TonB-dependent receptor [Sphingosinicella sp. CPCC 101087]|uniref:TonB-dependent receptor n=1 Tax=Sphingosinicella sp. CPCC 101087 TaxID=2497754 RepID=UPI00101E08E1|nr:TonB-dependent receptor [Sphingosinicella sp. CPCC 101087]
MTRPTFPTACSALALLAATPALAQETSTDGGDDQQIVVTAQLREQSLVEVPIAITAYDGQFLEALGLNELEELGRFVPGFDVQNQSPNNPGFVMRGITSDTGTAFGEPRVSVYQDGVSISKSRGSYVELFDMERVEVARGPQSTLYGRGALIGAVNLIQNKADPDRFEGLLRGGYGNYDHYLLEGMVNLPLGEGAAVRVAGRLRNRDGYVDNLLGGRDFNSSDTAAVRGALRFEPTSRITVDVIGNYQQDGPDGTSFKSTTFSPTDPATGAVIGTREPWTGAALAPGAGFEGGRPLGLDREVWGVTGIVNAELTDALTLTSISAYREFDSLEIFDADGISLPVLTAAEEAHGEQTSQELRLVWDDGGMLTGFIGASYFREEGFQRTPALFDERVLLARLTGTLNGPIPGRPATDPAPLPLFANTAFTAALLQGVAAASGVALAGPVAQGIAANLKAGHLESSTNFAETEAIDLFADLTLRLSPRFEVGAGLRYTHDDKSSAISAAVLNGRSILGGFIGALSQPEPVRTQLLTALAAPGAADIPLSPAFPVPLFGLGAQPTANNGDILSADLEDNGFSWRLYARFEPGPDSSIYATYTRGRRPELLSALPPGAPFGQARFDIVDAETVDSFEVGARTETLGRRLYLDGALFYYRYDNFQTTVQQGTLFVTTNAGEAESYGVEAQARYRASANAEIFATYAWNHSRLQTGVREGNRFRLSPDHSLSLGAMIAADLGPGRIDFTPSLTYQSRVYFDDDNDRPDLQAPPNALVPDLVQDETQEGYFLVNARLGYTLNERFRIEAFVNNLLDEEYVRDAGNTGDAIGFPTFIAGKPRLYGVQASVRF